MKYDGEMDKECVDLCDTLNRCIGIRTVASCCGHSSRPYKIWFRVDVLRNLPIICYHFDKCHCGFEGWKIVVRTDCSMCPVTFMIEGPSDINLLEATEQAKEIAVLIDEYNE